jgi:hypothetical protein
MDVFGNKEISCETFFLFNECVAHSEAVQIVIAGKSLRSKNLGIGSLIGKTWAVAEVLVGSKAFFNVQSWSILSRRLSWAVLDG